MLQTFMENLVLAGAIMGTLNVFMMGMFYLYLSLMGE